MEIDEFKIEEWMNKYEANAKIDLSITAIKPLTLDELFKIANIGDLSEISDIPLSYGDILGSKRLLDNIAGLYEKQNPNNIAITHGAIGANQLVFLSLLDIGDEVISIVPNYQQHSSIPKSIGATVKEIFLKEENQWMIDLDEIKKNITNKTKLITFSTPNNPTGSVIPDKILEQLANIADKYGIWILSDEVYRGLNLFGERYSKAMCDIYDKGISVGSMSKAYSLPGLRLGWICANENFINIINRHRQYNTISMSIIDDYLASVGLENREKIEERNLNLLHKNYDILKKFVANSTNCSCVLPTGGTVALLKYNKNIGSEDLCRNFQDETGIALLPGGVLDMENYVRIGFCVDTNDFETGLKEFDFYLDSLK